MAISFRSATAALALAAALALPSVAAAAEGDLDPSFGGSGTVVTPIPPGAIAYADTVDSQGRIVAGGFSGSYPNFELAAARYLDSGTLDTSFNGTGTEKTPIGSFAQGWAITTDAQDRVILAGTNGPDFVVVRYTPQGALDGSFGSGGIAITAVGSPATVLSVAVDAQGRIVAAGYAYNGADDDFALVRYTTAGMPDPSFGTSGVAITPIGTSNDEAKAVAIDSQGRIVAAGYSYEGSNIHLALVRYSTGGFPDPTFGSGGMVVPAQVTADDSATAVAIDPQGRIVVAGHSGAFPNEDFAVWRFNDDGSPDKSFSGGRVSTPIGNNNDDATGVGIDAEGHVLVGGSAGNGSNDDFALVRYTSGGALDPSFGNGGEVATPFGSGTIDDAAGLVIDHRQRIVLAGYTSAGGFALARYIDDARTPSVAISSGPKDHSYIRDPTPTFAFTADDPTATLGCSFDAGAAAACTSPFTPATRLRNGRHTFTVAATDPAGNVGSASRTFTVDTRKPKLKIRGRSEFRTAHRRGRAHFRLRASEKSKFRCRVDRHKVRRCKARYRTHKLRLGRHRLRVVAIDRAGNRVRKLKKFRIVPA